MICNNQKRTGNKSSVEGTTAHAAHEHMHHFGEVIYTTIMLNPQYQLKSSIKCAKVREHTHTSYWGNHIHNNHAESTVPAQVLYQVCQSPWTHTHIILGKSYTQQSCWIHSTSSSPLSSVPKSVNTHTHHIGEIIYTTIMLNPQYQLKSSIKCAKVREHTHTSYWGNHIHNNHAESTVPAQVLYQVCQSPWTHTHIILGKSYTQQSCWIHSTSSSPLSSVPKSVNTHTHHIGEIIYTTIMLNPQYQLKSSIKCAKVREHTHTSYWGNHIHNNHAESTVPAQVLYQVCQSPWTHTHIILGKSYTQQSCWIHSTSSPVLHRWAFSYTYIQLQRMPNPLTIKEVHQSCLEHGACTNALPPPPTPTPDTSGQRYTSTIKSATT